MKQIVFTFNNICQKHYIYDLFLHFLGINEDHTYGNHCSYYNFSVVSIKRYSKYKVLRNATRGEYFFNIYKYIYILKKNLVAVKGKQ